MRARPNTGAGGTIPLSGKILVRFISRKGKKQKQPEFAGKNRNGFDLLSKQLFPSAQGRRTHTIRIILLFYGLDGNNGALYWQTHSLFADSLRTGNIPVYCNSPANYPGILPENFPLVQSLMRIPESVQCEESSSLARAA